MSRKLGLIALIVVFSLGVIAAATADSKKNGATSTTTVTTSTTSINNGGGTPNCGNSCDQSHNPTDYEKPCDAVPGNGCHTLPDTPCERGHGGTEIGNKHCGSTPDLTILKEESTSPDTGFTHDGPFNVGYFTQIFYRITVTNNTGTAYTLSLHSTDTSIDPLCSSDILADPVDFSNTTLPAASGGTPGTVVYTCDLDANPGHFGIPNPAPSSFALVNTVTVDATPVGGGATTTLTDNVTANLS